MNYKIFRLYVSGVSQRRMSRLLRLHQLTVARKITFLGCRARLFNHRHRLQRLPIRRLQFDDMETFEHTKLKPLSITLAVEKFSRYIVGVEVARMPAKGLLAKRSLKKYGPRVDERKVSRQRLFRKIRGKIASTALIESDENPHYKPDVQEFFPSATHVAHKGQRGAITGQGELKKIGDDPLFSLNHTCAMLKANINRLFRRTWCTTKKIQPLLDHLELYVMYHNHVLIQ